MLFVLLACVHALPPSMTPAETLPVHTTDGWTLSLRHYPGPGEPVFLVHGMGADHYNWDYRPEVSLADYLQHQGWNVWVASLRGGPDTVAPSKTAARNFTFDDMAELDLPALVDAVLAQTGEEQLYWVGHSMGGMLLYTALTLYPERIRAGVAICSPASLAEVTPGTERIAQFNWLLGQHGAIPVSKIAPLANLLGKDNFVTRRISNPANMDWVLSKGMLTEALVDMPRPLAQQGVSWVKSGKIVDRNGWDWVRPADVPILVMGANQDEIVPVANVKQACEIYPQCTYQELGTNTGFIVDYGHVDPVVGKTARAEVYPIIEGFIRDNLMGL